MTQTGILILAGGEGRRIGGQKPTRLLNGRSLIELAIQKAESYGANIALQLSHKGQLDLDRYPQIIDTPDIDGPLGGIASGLKFMQAQGYERMLTLPCDSPFLPDDLLTRLSDNITGSKKVAVAFSAENLYPVCALWNICHLPQIEENAKQQKLSLKGAAKDCGMIKVEWETSPIDPFFNINTIEDLKTAETFVGQFKNKPKKD